MATLSSIITPTNITTASNTQTLTNKTLTGAVMNGTVGATTPSTVAATTISATGAITPSQTAGIVGTTTNNNANAGSVGEYLNQITASGSAVALTTATQHNIATITLTAGDWDVGGTICFSFGAGTTIAWTRSCVNNSSASITQDYKTTSITTPITGGTIDTSFAVPTTRWSVSTTTQIWLVTQTSFSVSTLSGYGNLWARRAR